MFRQRVPENSQNWVCRISHFSLILLLWALQMFFNIGTFCFCLRQVHMFTLPSIIFSVPSTNQMMSCESGKSMYKYKGQTVHRPVVSRSELLPRQVWAACWNHRPSELRLLLMRTSESGGSKTSKKTISILCCYWFFFNLFTHIL